MARPRVFVSSTFYDLKHIRASLEIFIESLGFDAILFEKGDIAFHPDSALDESCYREASTADIFVLVIGGRYGSAVSGVPKPKKPKFFEQYESITRKEFETAQAADVPTFILVDSAVHAEYQTYLRNRENEDINYAHVDSSGVFRLLEDIFEKNRNNPVFNFERATEIEAWLREQWAGLFRELLRTRSQQKQISTLNSQVTELKSVNDTLKTYLEVVLAKVTPDDAAILIKDEEKKLEEARRRADLAENYFYQYLIKRKVSDEVARSIISDPKSPEDAFEKLESELAIDATTRQRGTVLRRSRGAQRDYNEARRILGEKNLNFRKIPLEDFVSSSRAEDASDSDDSDDGDT